MNRRLPIIILLAILVVAVYFGLHKYLSFEVLKENRNWLTSFVDQNFIIACLAFSTIYIISVAASIPGASFLTITGGFLFGIVTASFLVVISATIGATLLYLAVRTAFGDVLRKKARGFVKKMEEGFLENSFNYLLSIRLIPIFPFWAINIVAAILSVPLSTFVIATGLGIIPGSVVYVLIGNGLGAVIEAGGSPDLKIIFSPEILTPLLGLAVLSLIPIIYKKIKAGSKK